MESAQFFKILVEIRSGSGDLYVFIFFSLLKTISLEKLRSLIQSDYTYLLDKLKSIRGGSAMTPLANVSANILATLSFSCTATPEPSLSCSDLTGPDSLVRICLKRLFGFLFSAIHFSYTNLASLIIHTGFNSDHVKFIQQTNMW